MAENVLADPQFGIEHTLRPFGGFEAVYEGRDAATVPIAFPGTRDPRAAAGAAGYDPNYLGGVPCPEGAQMQLLIPFMWQGGAAVSYLYTLHFRRRYRLDAEQLDESAYHGGALQQGALSLTGQPRFVRYSWNPSILYTSAPPAGSDRAIHTLRPESYLIVPSTPVQQPLYSDGSLAVYQQGVVPGADADSSTYALSNVAELWIRCRGDEFLITVSRPTGGNWAFNVLDQTFSQIYGNGTGTPIPGLGIKYVFGAAP